MGEAVIEIGGRQYQSVVGSDVTSRDGMFLELWDGADQLVEVFYSDADGAMTISAYRHDLPLAVVEWAIAEARRRLPVQSQ